MDEMIGRLVDEQLPALQQHFDMQLAEIKSEQRAIRSALEASHEHTNAINSRIETVNNRLQMQDVRQAEILEQTKRTNGRVSELEKWQAFQQGVKAGSGQSWGILVAGSAVVGTLISVATNLVLAFVGK